MQQKESHSAESADPVPEPRSGLNRIVGHMEPATAGWPPISIALNSNENACGPSPLAIAAARSATTFMHRYVEGQDAVLVPAIAKRYSLDAAKISIGCGSDDLLARLASAFLRPGSELLRSSNSYLKVPKYAYANDAIPVSARDREFTPIVDELLSCITPRTRMLYIANPDNPSGALLSVKELKRLHGNLPPDVLLVVDCAYAEYVDVDQQGDLFDMVEHTDNIVVTRTFSKVYGMAGARVGWIYGSRNIADAVNRICLTFPISTPSLFAALAALEDRQHIERVVEMNRELRVKYSRRFGRMCRKVYPSQTNFLLLDFENCYPDAAQVEEFLRSKGIAVRRFFSSAYKDCIRITLGHESELEAAASMLEQCMRGWKRP